MNILLNGEPARVPVNTTIAQLLKIRNITQSKGVAIACNEDVVHRSQWESTILQEGDAVEILQATAGG